MKITLISKSFKTRAAGLGSYAKILYETLKDDDDLIIEKISQKNDLIKNRGLSSFFFAFIEIPLRLRTSDVYHALNPLECFYLNPKKSVVTIHDLHRYNFPNKDIYNKIVHFFYRKAMKNAIKFKKIICISKETCNELKSRFDVCEDRIYIVRQSIDKKYHPTFKKNDIFTIGTISVLSDTKRVDLLIKAFLEADLKNSQLLIGGTGFLENELKKLAKDNPKIKFLGFVDDNEMNDFYNSLDVFVFPSIREGYGLPIVEAMACGKPVITLDDSEIPSEIKNRTHVSKFSNLSKDLINKNFDCDIESNLKFAKEEHSYEKAKKQLKEIYSSIIDES